MCTEFTSVPPISSPSWSLAVTPIWYFNVFQCLLMSVDKYSLAGGSKLPSQFHSQNILSTKNCIHNPIRWLCAFSIVCVQVRFFFLFFSNFLRNNQGIQMQSCSFFLMEVLRCTQQDNEWTSLHGSTQTLTHFSKTPENHLFSILTLQ